MVAIDRVHRKVLLEEREVEFLLMRTLDRNIVSRVGMTHDTRRGIIEEDSFDPPIGFSSTIATKHDPGVLREAHANTAAMMQRNPCGAAGRVEQRIEQRPIETASDPSCMASVSRFGLATDPESK